MISGAKEGPHRMRHQYTPIFRDVLTSRVWALSDAHLRVWLWLQLMADPEGYVCADLAGVAIGARVDGQDAREALELLGLPDADACPDDPNEGRIIERVTRGWRILGVEASRDLVKAETRKARQRRYMKASRARAAKDQDVADVHALLELTSEPVGLPVSPPIPTPKPKPKEEGEDSPLPPVVQSFIEEHVAQPREYPTEYPGSFEAPSQVPVTTRVIHAIPAAWLPSESLRADAAIAGVQKFDERLASLRGGPIGGTRGVFESALDDYIRSFFGKWRTWEETDRAKAATASRKPWEEPPPKPPEDLVKGLPRWVRQRHEALAGSPAKLRQLAKRFAQSHHIPPDNLDVNLATQAFEQFIAGWRNAGEAA